MQALDKFRDDEGQLVRRGELIYGHYKTVDSILNAIRAAREKGYSWDDIRNILKGSRIPEAMAIKSVNTSKGTITITLDGEDIELDARLSVTQNSQMYYDRSKKEIEQVMFQEGQKLCHAVGVYNLPRDLIPTLGRFKYRTSYGQNMISHTLEETRIGIKLANEVGANVDVVRLGCLLHDIGKVIEGDGNHTIS